MDITEYDSLGIIPRPKESIDEYRKRAPYDYNLLRELRSEMKGKPLSKFGMPIPDNIAYEPEEPVDIPECKFYNPIFPMISFKNINDFLLLMPSSMPGDSLSTFGGTYPIKYKGRDVTVALCQPQIRNVEDLRKDIVESRNSHLEYLKEHPREGSLEKTRKYYEKRLEHLNDEFLEALKKQDNHKRHETIHQIRGFGDFGYSNPFEEFISYLLLGSKKAIAIGYTTYLFLEPESRSKLNIIKRYVEGKHVETIYSFLESGLREKVPLPLLSRITFKEFKEIFERLFRGESMDSILDEKRSGSYGWRWQLIADKL